MKRNIILAAFALIMTACGNQSAPVVEDSTLKVAASIPPLAQMVEAIGGETVEVVSILPAGASPHTFELTPSVVKELTGASLAFSIGHELDHFMEDLVASVDGLEMYVVDESIKLKEMDHGDDHEDEDGHEYGEFDPHYWLSPKNANIMARNVANVLMAVDPENAGSYMQNLLAYQDEVNAAKDAIKLELSDLKNRKIIVFHDSWDYFADAFDFEVLASFESEPGREASAKDLEELYQLAKEHEIRVVYSEPQLSPELLKPFVEDLGLELKVMDPLGAVEGRESIAEILKYNAFLIYEAQK